VSDTNRQFSYGQVGSHTLFFNHQSFSVAQNFKVFSTAVAEKIYGEGIKRPQFCLANSQEPSFPVALLVGDPFVKFFAACREDKLPPYTALALLKTGNFPTFHFLPQSRYLHGHNNSVYAWLAPEHIPNFWETLKLGTPPEIYDQLLSDEETKFKNQHEFFLRDFYASDFELRAQIKSAGQIVSIKECPRVLEMLSKFGTAVHRFARAGFATTPPEALATREATCRACPEWDAQALNNTGRCRKCGCATWAKLRMATERCPIGKWEAVTQTPDSRPSDNPNNADEPTNN
jgi:hypothetical protein